MVVYWTTMAVTGNGELGFDSGEGAWETATTSKEGSRRVNYPILTQGGSDKKYQYKTFVSCNWDERNLNRFSSINWRASLVPAAAVIPAPIAYIKIVAVKTLVVGFLRPAFGPTQCRIRGGLGFICSGRCLHFVVCHVIWIFTLRKWECSKQAIAVNMIAWNNSTGLLVQCCWFVELE